MTLQELKHRIHSWCAYYRNQCIPLNQVHVVITLEHPDRHELVEITQDDIQHGHYEAMREDEEIVGGYKGQLLFISLRQFNTNDDLNKDDVIKEEKE